jgi:F-type H+-transporting ATPase subunit b
VFGLFSRPPNYPETQNPTVNVGEQLGALFLQAAPTVLIVLFLYLFLRANLFKPLERVLAERSTRIEGARKESETSQAAALEKEKQYQEALKKARSEVYAEQEQARRAVLEQRAAMVRDTRNACNERIRAAKGALAADLAAARRELERESDALAADIARAILERRPPASPASRGAR